MAKLRINASWMACAVAVVMGTALALPAGAGDLTVSNFGSYIAPDAIPNFNKETGETAQLVEHATNAEITGKIIASGGKGYDVVFVSSVTAEILNKLGLLESIDHAKVPNLANLYPEATKLPHDPGNTFSVPYTWGTTVLCYREDLVKQPPSSWKDLLNPPADLAGKVTMLGEDRWLLAAGFLARGYSVNEKDPAKIEEATADLIAAKKTMLSYDDYTMASKLASGEALVTQAWDNMCALGIPYTPTIKYVVPKEGSDFWVDEMVVLKSSQNKDGAFKFINFVLDAKNHAWTAQNILSKVPNKPAMESLSPDLVKEHPALGIAPADIVKLEQLRDVGETTRAYSKAVATIKAAN